MLYVTRLKTASCTGSRLVVVTVGGGRALIAALDAMCLSSAADSSDNWMLSATAHVDEPAAPAVWNATD